MSLILSWKYVSDTDGARVQTNSQRNIQTDRKTDKLQFLWHQPLALLFSKNMSCQHYKIWNAGNRATLWYWWRYRNRSTQRRQILQNVPRIKLRFVIHDFGAWCPLSSSSTHTYCHNAALPFAVTSIMTRNNAPLRTESLVCDFNSDGHAKQKKPCVSKSMCAWPCLTTPGLSEMWTQISRVKAQSTNTYNFYDYVYICVSKYN